MPAFRRTDAHRWSKWKFYPGAVTVLLPRFFFGVLSGALLCLFLFFALIGQPMDQPIGGCRRVIIRWAYKFFTFLFQFFANWNFVTWHTLSMEDVNYYEEWLGPREEQEKEQMAQPVNEPQHLQMGSTDASDNNGVSNSLINDRKVPKRGVGPPSTIVCNHIGWIEVMGLI